MIQTIQISDHAHDQFVKTHPHGDMCQLTSWGRVKQAFGWQWSRVSVGEKNQIRGVASLLYKKVPLINKTICYISRGFVVDWFDEASVQALLKAVKDDAKKHDAFLIKIDPDLPEDTPNLLHQIESFGFKHQGFTFGFKEAAQPRFHMVTDLGKSEKDLLNSLQGLTRTNIRRASKYGFTLEEAPVTKMDIFHELMKETGERDDFLIRDISYFKQIYHEMQPKGEAKLFLVKLNPEAAIKGLDANDKNRRKEIKSLKKKDSTPEYNQQIKQLEEALENAAHQKETIKQIAQEHPEGFYLSGAIFVQSGSKAYYLYGASSNQLRDLLPNDFMVWEMMRYAQKQGCLSFDFGGVSGLEGKPEDDAPGLYIFKKRWSAVKRARIGEFDYELSHLLSNLYRQAFKLRQKLLGWRKNK
ncbi:peptidoglycan bridge formation glycyltransferase FemA/FemB family protein [Facklamia sp. 7083-14-GEN3]|uniref:lipid II:glycine glycyltransferase FemX n=1 Tax=Facklamia sp. 7083-14-GEN3 TaxID=2973478 RepID=UPI00215D38E1|nr:peptidoglycan bridge formation glycyltransferase FemA/FemB family protein [Facklamia sp. 7083-14-GEN3]MCR8968416.1 peptidoglycan bridge formation glycyltransferase FemA/FemB family protein [Facklamia sp. 7083-14-GEN3]